LFFFLKQGEEKRSNTIPIAIGKLKNKSSHDERKVEKVCNDERERSFLATGSEEWNKGNDWRDRWFAMSDLNYNNNAKTTLKNVHQALDGLWDFIETKGKKQDIVIPLISSGLGRLTIERKKLIAIIAQSFLNASEDNIFSNKLIIVIHPSDVDKANLTLFEDKDLLNHYLP
jgi:hypothetical protein